MWAQSAVVALIVLGCAVYAVWTLAPSNTRRCIAQTLLELHLPRAFETRMRKHAAAPTGCVCEGCDRAPHGRRASSVQTIRLHLRQRR